jgi:hypothetical protein
MIQRLVQITQWNGSEYGKNEKLKAVYPTTDYDKAKTTGECGMFSYQGGRITSDARCCHGKSSIEQEETLFHQQIGIKFKE